MNKAKQERTKLTTSARMMVISFLLLAAAIGSTLNGFNSNDSTASLDSLIESAVQQIEPQVTNIQKQTPTLEVLSTTDVESREQYNVKSGDSPWLIAIKTKPNNVELNDYISILQEMNDGKKLVPGAMLDIPNNSDLKDVTLPDIDVKFNLSDTELINHLKHAEGTAESQANVKRRLLGGKVGPTFKNGKFYPYKDPHGFWTIGYGHLISKTKESLARKYANGITKQEANELLKDDMERVYADFVLLLQRKRATNLPSSIQKVLYEMTYNMGSGGLANFENMWRHLKKGRYQQASKEMLNSSWAKQVQYTRSARLSYALATNQYSSSI